MKSLYSFLLITIASLAVSAQPKFGAVLVNVDTMKNCKIDYPFNPPGFGNPQFVIFWAGKCLNGKANGIGYVADSNSAKGYYAEFRDGKLYNNVFAELKENGLPKIKGYVPGEPFASDDENYCARNADRCDRLLNYFKSEGSITLEESTEDNCATEIKVTTNPYFYDVKWSGRCVNGRAEGSGWLTYKNKHNDTIETYTDYSKGKPSSAYFYRRIRSAYTGPSEYLGKSPLGTFITEPVTSCKNDQTCQRISKIGKQGPGSSSNKSGNQSDVSSNSGNSSTSVGGLGPITPPPADFLRSIKGERVACTEAALGAFGYKMKDKYRDELNTNSMCTVARGTAKAHYEVIITIEKSCSPDMIPQVADMQPLRDVLQSALDTIEFSCP